MILQRVEDGFSIPYERVHSMLHCNWSHAHMAITGITLISVLRLGISEEQREWLYDLFVHMPLYEDMAPWNIGMELETQMV